MKEFIVFVLITLLFVGGVVAVLANNERSTIDRDDYTEKTYVVKSGDTMWAIARKNILTEDKIDDYIEAVNEINGGVHMVIGEVITILVQK